MKNAVMFTALVLSCLFYVGCSKEEQVDSLKVDPPKEEQGKRSTKMISSRTPDAGMLAAVGISPSEPNARIAQLYNEEEAVVAVYDSEPSVEFLFIPYENQVDKVGVFPFYKGEYIPFKANLERVGDDDIKVTTDGSQVTYTMEKGELKGIDLVRHANVMTADEIKELRMQRRNDTGVEDMIKYYTQCMEYVVERGAWFCGGCYTGQLAFSIGCFAFEPCAWGANVSCIALAIADHMRRNG